MTINGSVIGIADVLKNIKDAEKKIGVAVSRGLRIAGLILQRESQLMVPVDFGLLKASAFTRATGREMRTVVSVGYTAKYAIYVHENVDEAGRGKPRQAPSKGNYWDPAGRGQSKFLEKPFVVFHPKLVKVVAAEVKKVI